MPSVTDKPTFKPKYDDADRLRADLEQVFTPLTKLVEGGGEYLSLTNFGRLDTKSAFYQPNLGLTRDYYFARVVQALPLDRLCKQLGIDVSAISFHNVLDVYLIRSDRFDADKYLVLTPLDDEPEDKAEPEPEAKS